MSPEKKQKIEKNLKIIAKREGITPEEVKSEIGRAVSYAMKSSDPKAQRFWNNFPCEGDSPTVEEVIAYLAEKLSKEICQCDRTLFTQIVILPLQKLLHHMQSELYFSFVTPIHHKNKTLYVLFRLFPAH